MTIAIDRVARFTLDAYHRMIEAGILADRRVELLDGVIVDMAPEGPYHAHSSDQAGRYLTLLLGEQAWVRQAKPITLVTSNSEPQPDLSIVEPLDYAEQHPCPENIYWVIEYSKSTLDSDREVKRKTYAEANIQEYWIVDLINQQLLVFRKPEAGNYQEEVALDASQEIKPVAFPTLSVPVSRLLARAKAQASEA